MAGRPRRTRRADSEVLRSAIVPGYVMLKVIGNGGQARIFKAARSDGEGHVTPGAQRLAVKVYQGGHAQRSMRSEFRFLSALQGHGNIVRLVECFDREPSTRALVLELCDRDLHALAARRKFSELEAVTIMRGALSALEHMHQLGIVHRDVKPENIGIVSEDSARLMDFGFAAQIADRKEMRTPRGSLEYMAPELFTKKTYGPAVDIFAFGASLYFFLGKQYPLGRPGITWQAAAAYSRRYQLSFGSNFDHVSDDCIKMMLWLMHPCDAWRPDASFALTCPPFEHSFRQEQHSLLPSFEAQLQSRDDAMVQAEPPSYPRERSGRSTKLVEDRMSVCRKDSSSSSNQGPGSLERSTCSPQASRIIHSTSSAADVERDILPSSEAQLQSRDDAMVQAEPPAYPREHSGRPTRLVEGRRSVCRDDAPDSSNQGPGSFEGSTCSPQVSRLIRSTSSAADAERDRLELLKKSRILDAEFLKMPRAAWTYEH